MVHEASGKEALDPNQAQNGQVGDQNQGQKEDQDKRDGSPIEIQDRLFKTDAGDE